MADTNEPSEVTSTQSIVESAMAEIPDDGGSDLSVEESTPPESGSIAASSAVSSIAGGPAPTQDERDELAEALGIIDKGKGKWIARTPYSKVSKIVKERETKTKADHEAALKQHTDRVSAYEQQIAQFDQLVANPAALISALAQVHPAYRQYVTNTAPQTDAPPQFNSVADLTQYVQSQIDQHVSQRLAPIEQERAARDQIARNLPIVQQQIAEAKTWPMFVESQAEILAALQKNPKSSLHAAYQSVVLPKLSASREQVRQQVIAEMNARPHSTVAGSSVTGRTAPEAAQQDTSDIVREAMRGLK